MRYHLLFIAGLSLNASGQTHTLYSTGSPEDLLAMPMGGICLMGGAGEHDGAMHWFNARAAGGDVLVLRASGSDGYNDYLYGTIGGVNSVTTVVVHERAGASDPTVLALVDRAEAIWFAGGDQWNYVERWRGTPLQERINVAITERNVVVGGTSAGMAILGSSYFSGQFGSVTSTTALADPYAAIVDVDHIPFITLPYMGAVITDSHFDERDRRGRLTAFMARMTEEYGESARAIACNEYTAVVVDPQGQARVFGEWPAYPEYAYFVQVNCVPPNLPEVLAVGRPLTWLRDGEALKVYQVPGTDPGSHGFDLTDWRNGHGGTWQHWTVNSGTHNTAAGTGMLCGTGLPRAMGTTVEMHWDPLRGTLTFSELPAEALVQVYGVDGVLLAGSANLTGNTCQLQARGVLLIELRWPAGRQLWRVLH